MSTSKESPHPALGHLLPKEKGSCPSLDDEGLLYSEKILIPKKAK